MKKKNIINIENICLRCGQKFRQSIKEDSNDNYIKQYCSRKCANIRCHSEETRKKISKGVKESDIWKAANEIAILKRIKKIKKICLCCGKEFEVTQCFLHQKVCSRKCYIQFSPVFNAGNGGYRGSSKKYKHQWYTSPIAGLMFLDSSWEVKYAKFLDKENIEWKRNKEKFPYVFENKIRNYIPDFYLIATNEYVEVKGYMTKKDEEKIRQFPCTHKLLVLQKSGLKNLGIII